MVFFLLLKAKHAAEIGADGIAVIAPFFLKPWNKGKQTGVNITPHIVHFFLPPFTMVIFNS